MSNFVNHQTLREREIEMRLEAGFEALIASGVKASDITDRDIEKIVSATYEALSPAAKEQSAQAGLHHMVKQVFGERLAEAIWEAGTGWPETEDEVRSLAASMGISPDDAPECLQAFRSAADEVTVEDIEVFRSLSQFTPLFIGTPKDAQLADVATTKAKQQDKLALSFLAWRDLA